MYTNITQHIHWAVRWCKTHPAHLSVVLTAVACAVTMTVQQNGLQSLLWPRPREVIVTPSSSSASSLSSRRRAPYRVTRRRPVRSPALSSARRTIVPRSSSSVMSRRPWHPAANTSSASSHINFSPAYEAMPAPAQGAFPAFGHAVYPVSQVPNWGAMHNAAQWNRTYAELTRDDLVPVPAYDMQKLMTPFKTVVADQDEEEITRKLFYSTKYFGKYDLDAGEFTAIHPGVDLKLALGTPIAAIGGGRVNTVESSPALGTHVVIEHRLPDGTYYSIYGHLGSVSVAAGQDITAGQTIGTVGMTGNTSAPHLHLQVDRGQPGEVEHIPYLPKTEPTPQEAALHVVHPIHFIEQY